MKIEDAYIMNSDHSPLRDDCTQVLTEEIQQAALDNTPKLKRNIPGKSYPYAHMVASL